MRHTCVSVMLLALSTTLSSCGRSEDATATAIKKITVTGTSAGVERFVKLQGSAPIPLIASAITPLGEGRAKATVTIPANFGGRDIVHTTREALAAGLSYSYEELHFSSKATS